jgi:transcriptional regulator with XRE-family HTH domain
MRNKIGRALEGAVASAIRDQRTARGLTQEEAATKAKISIRHWQRIEAGEANPRVSTLALAAMALRVHPSVLFEADA